MFPVAVIVAVIFIIALSYIWKLNTTSRPSSKNKEYLLFIDAPDPDNPAAALAVWHHHIQCRNKERIKHHNRHLHIILSGRQIDLKTAHQPPTKENIVRQNWEKNNSKHAQCVLEDSAARITNYLTKCGVPSSDFTIYNGGIPPSAPISDVVHVLDFLFDRKDLVSGQVRDQGEVLVVKEYNELLDEYSKLSEEERESKLLEILRHYKLSPLEELSKKLLDRDIEICVFVGGPATALVELFSGPTGKEIAEKVTEFYAMFGSLEPGVNTLLPNQFNVACDFDAASTLFVENLLPNVKKYLITTETAKLPDLVLSADELQAHGIKNYLVSVQRLWQAAHGSRPQPLFDVLPVMASLNVYRDSCFTWLKKKAVVQEWVIWIEDRKTLQVFSFADSDSDNLMVSSDCFNSDRNTYIKFLKQSF